MKVQACLWYETPGAHAEMKGYNSILEVVEDFDQMRRDYLRFGEVKPVGYIYHPDDLQNPTHSLSLGPRDGIRIRHVPV